MKTDVTAVQDAQVATNDMIAILNTMVSDFSMMIAAQVDINIIFLITSQQPILNYKTTMLPENVYLHLFE